jgi:hypothetical protein
MLKASISAMSFHRKNLSILLTSAILVFVCSLIFANTVFANTVREEWKIIGDYPNYSLQLKTDAKVKIALTSENIVPKIVMVMPHEKHQDVDLIVYFSGRIGTREMTDIYHAVMYNNRTKKIMGVAPYRVTEMGKFKKLLPKDEQPAWSSDQKSIKVTVPDTGEKQSFEVK